MTKRKRTKSTPLATLKDAVAYGVTGMAGLGYAQAQAALYAYDTAKSEVIAKTTGGLDGIVWHLGKLLYGVLPHKQDPISFARLVRDGALDSTYQTIQTYQHVPLAILSAGLAYTGAQMMGSKKKKTRRGEWMTLAGMTAATPVISSSIDTASNVLIHGYSTLDALGNSVLHNPSHPLMAAGAGALASLYAKGYRGIKNLFS